MSFPLWKGVLRLEVGQRIADSMQGNAVLKIGQVPYAVYEGSTSSIDVDALRFVSAHRHLEKHCLGASEIWLNLSNRYQRFCPSGVLELTCRCLGRVSFVCVFQLCVWS